MGSGVPDSKAAGKPETVSAAEVRATQRVAAAQQALHRSFSGTLLKMAAGGAALYTAYHMWQHSEEPLPEPMTEAVSNRGSADCLERHSGALSPLAIAFVL
jgi:hypothetical protein